MEALSDLQAEYMADDVELTEEMTAWTEAEVRVFFEHMLRPTPAETWRLWFPGWRAPAETFRCRAICLHNAGSSASMWTRNGMQHLANEPRIELLAVELPGRGNRTQEPFFTSSAKACEALAEVLAPYLSQPVPWIIIGHSMGCWLGYELWRTLRAKHGSVQAPSLFAASCFPPPSLPPSEWPWPRLAGGSAEAQLASFREADPSGLKTFKADVRQWGTPESLLEDDAFVAAVLMPTMTNDKALFDTYYDTCVGGGSGPPEPLPPGCLVFATAGANDPMIDQGLVERWFELCASADCFVFETSPGDHLFVTDVAHCEMWCQRLMMQLFIQGPLKGA